MKTNSEDNWLARLAGKQIETHADDPDYGFYRVRTRDRKGWTVYAYWYSTNGDLRCKRDGVVLDETPAMKSWEHASENAITYEQYQDALAGKPWSDIGENLTRLNRAPDDDSFEGIRDAIESLEAEAKRMIAAGAAKTRDEADQAGNVIDRLGKLYKKADAAREVEKRPHLTAARNVDERWAPLKSAAEIYKRLKAVVCQPFLDAEVAKKREAEAQARRQQEAAAKAAREAEDKARREQEEAQRAGSIKSEIAAEKAAKEAEAATRAAAQAKRVADDIAAQTVTAGSLGRGVHLRTLKTAKIVDYDKCLYFYGQSPKVVELIQQLANASVRAGTIPAGCEIHEEQVAA